ncbi:MAG: DUF2062 domain-containing protein [Geminicoccaceae bacterium]
MRLRRDKTYRPGLIARSLSVGAVIGFLPLVGLQALLTALVCLLASLSRFTRLNFLIALAATMVVNPLTMAPTYYLYYRIGCLGMTCEAEVNAQTFRSLDSLFQVGSEISLAVLIGSLPFVIIGGPIFYYLGHLIEMILHRRAEARAQKRQNAGMGIIGRSGLRA